LTTQPRILSCKKELRQEIAASRVPHHGKPHAMSRVCSSRFERARASPASMKPEGARRGGSRVIFNPKRRIVGLEAVA